MKPRKLYIRNGILHCCYKGSHYAPEMGDDGEMESELGVKDLVLIHGGDKGCDTVDVRSGEMEETWVKTDVDAAAPGPKKVPVDMLAPRNVPPEEVFSGDDEVEPEAETEEEAERQVKEHIRDKQRAAALAGRPAHKVANILDL